MMRQFAIIMSVVMSVIATLSAFAGTWSDGFGHRDPGEWIRHVFLGNPPVWEVKQGRMQVDATGLCLLVVGKDWWEDYIGETTVILLEKRPIGAGTPPSFGAGLMMYYDKVDKCYFCAIYTGLWDGRGPGILLGVGDGWGPPILSDYKSLEVEFGFEYRIKMTEEAGLIKGYLGGVPLLEIPMDERITSGTPALYILNMRADFDDFMVTGENILDGGPGGLSFSIEPQDKLPITWAEIKKRE